MQNAFALQIHQIRITENSPRTINISLDTEASELYYFHSGQSQISGNIITVKAFYINGFGSTIAYLNNNFEIPINPKRKMGYQLNVKVYYTNLQDLQNSENLQDQWTGFFLTPLSAPTSIIHPIEENPLNFKYQNPNPGFISVGSQNVNVAIFNAKGKFIENKKVHERLEFSHLPNGLYYFRFTNETTSQTIPIILKK
ncbi:hypothetical protein FNO01nite_06150 [Flavobacterium noncentrifugens]|nr:hypothetical protein FNO01nite_06150 [Flavobacterium noncentrifugens]